MNQQIGKQTLQNQKELKAKLLTVLAKNTAGLTKNEMLIQSGISQELIDFILRDILEDYTVHLEVREQNQVIYLFDVDSPKNNALKKASQLKKLWESITRSLIFFGAVILALSWTILAIPIGFTLLGLYLVAGFFHIFFNQGFAVGAREYMVYWMGREESPEDKLLEEKVILSYLSQKGYLITVAELMPIMDWSYQKAEQEVVWLLVNYGGEPIVDNSGVIIFDFTNLKDDTATIQQVSREYQLQLGRKILEKNEYRKEPIKVSSVDVFSLKRWERNTYLVMKVYLMNYYLGAVLFLGTLVGGIIIWYLINSNGDIKSLWNSKGDMTDYDMWQAWLWMIIFALGYIITFKLAVIVVWRWFMVQIPAKRVKQIAVLKSILYEYIFETLPQNTLFQVEALSDKLIKYRAVLPINDKSIGTDDIIKEVLTDVQAEPTAQANGKLAYSLEHIAQELNVVQSKRGEQETKDLPK